MKDTHNKLPPIFFFIGMPGAGKSFWAQNLVDNLGFEAIDIDDEIEENEDMSITDIFEKQGEAYFREKERETLASIISYTKSLHEAGNGGPAQPVVIACGGGTPCFFDNIEQMKKNGTVIYLKTEPITLVSRIAPEIDKRPLLAEKTELVEYATELLNSRKSIYEQAHYILHSEDISLINFEQIISSCTHSQ